MGYVGPCIVHQLKKTYPEAVLIGYDTAFFSTNYLLPITEYLPERELTCQYFGDIRDCPETLLKGVDVVINLAAISNDPMGAKFEEVTMDVNHKTCVEIAKKSKEAGVRSFIFASSCSVYGTAGNDPKTEQSELNPLTAYGKSKIFAERDLEPLADENFSITCLRFSAACGMSSRLRLDLVLNDFVACALACKQITILSDGTPWRPLIHVKDMALAVEWAIGRPKDLGDFLTINTGADSWNYQIKDLAEAVARVIPDVELSFSRNATSDRRSYLVNFGLYKKLAPDHQPRFNLYTAIEDIANGLKAANFKDPNFRDSNLIRLKVLTMLQAKKLLSDNLRWV